MVHVSLKVKYCKTVWQFHLSDTKVDYISHFISAGFYVNVTVVELSSPQMNLYLAAVTNNFKLYTDYFMTNLIMNS